MKIKKIITDKLTEIVITNKEMEVSFLNLGAAIRSIKIKDTQLVVSPKSIEDYKKNQSFFGQTIGRTSGRISHAKFTLNDILYNLEKNDKENNLHGGFNGLSTKIWDFDIIHGIDQIKIVYSVFVLNKEDFFPGDFNARVTYTIYEDETLIKIDYEAISNQDTLCNMTNHSYFNLSGDIKNTVLDHELLINASKYTKLNSEMICEKIANVTKVMDFRKSKRIGLDITSNELKNTRGYDHGYIIDNMGIDKKNIIIYCRESKIKMFVYTSYPCVVIYTYNYPQDTILLGKNELSLKHDGICFECQYIPNGINMNVKDKGILLKNKHYHETTIFKFEVE